MDWFEAARTGDLDTLGICLFWGQRVDQRSRDGRTALRIAAEHGQTEAVELLLERKADPNADAPGIGRPLTTAIEYEHWEIAAALVRGGADPNVGGVASIVIAEPPKRQLLALMLSRGLDPHGAHEDWGPYIHFALNDPACADLFFAAGFDLARHERETGESLLERALSNGVNRFLHLLALGADVNPPVDRRTGRTMLMTLAAEDAGKQAHALIRLLVKRGADLDQRDADGRTALDYARARDDGKTLALLTRLRDNLARARERGQKQRANAEAKSRATAAAKAARERNAAAKRADAAERFASRELAQLETAKAKLTKRTAPASKTRPAASREKRRPLREFASLEKPATSEANPSAETLHQHG